MRLVLFNKLHPLRTINCTFIATSERGPQSEFSNFVHYRQVLMEWIKKAFTSKNVFWTGKKTITWLFYRHLLIGSQWGPECAFSNTDHNQQFLLQSILNTVTRKNVCWTGRQNHWQESFINNYNLVHEGARIGIIITGIFYRQLPLFLSPLKYSCKLSCIGLTFYKSKYLYFPIHTFTSHPSLHTSIVINKANWNVIF